MECLKKRICRVLRHLLALPLLVVAVSTGSAFAEDKEVTVAYQLIVGPYLTAIANGSFEKATGYKIKWRQFNSGGEVTSAMASGDVPIGVIGSTGLAASASRGVELELFWILDNIGKSEALVVRNGSGINGPQELKGKKVAVPFVSTSHFHTMLALQAWGIKPNEVQLLNMQPPQIVAAWTRGDIDAAYVWPPALLEIEKSGKTLITSEEVGKKTVPTFDGIVANRDWAAKHAEFMQQFTKVLAQTYEDYNKNAAAWTADSPQVKAMVKLIGGTAQDHVTALKLLSFPRPQEQVSTQWLGGGKEGGALRALTQSAEFLKNQRQIDRVLPDYSPFVTVKYAQEASK